VAAWLKLATVCDSVLMNGGQYYNPLDAQA
jgi:hypothetical protein